MVWHRTACVSTGSRRVGDRMRGMRFRIAVLDLIEDWDWLFQRLSRAVIRACSSDRRPPFDQSSDPYV